MPPVTQQQLPQHVTRGLFAAIGTNLERYPAIYSRFCTVKTSDGPYEKAVAAAGLPVAQMIGEADPIPTVDPIEGNTKQVTFDEEWGIGVEFTRRAMDDDLLRGKGSALQDAASNLSSSIAERVEIEAHRPFMEGFSGTTFAVLPDNTALFGTHTPISGGEAGSQVNFENVDFSVSSYRDARIRMRKYTNDRGIRISGYNNVARLIGPVDNEYVFNEVLKSQMRPDTANPVANVTRNDVAEIITSPFITDVDSWFLQATSHYFWFWWRTRPVYDSFDDRLRRVSISIAWMRFKMLPFHWYGMHGSLGA